MSRHQAIVQLLTSAMPDKKGTPANDFNPYHHNWSSEPPEVAALKEQYQHLYELLRANRVRPTTDHIIADGRRYDSDIAYARFSWLNPATHGATYQVPSKALQAFAETTDSRRLKHLLNELEQARLTLDMQKSREQDIWRNYRIKGRTATLPHDGHPDFASCRITNSTLHSKHLDLIERTKVENSVLTSSGGRVNVEHSTLTRVDLVLRQTDKYQPSFHSQSSTYRHGVIDKRYPTLMHGGLSFASDQLEAMTLTGDFCGATFLARDRSPDTPCSFTECVLDGKFNEANFTDARFSACSFQGNFQKACWAGSHFDNTCIFTGNFANSDFTGATFAPGSDLTQLRSGINTSLSAAQLTGCVVTTHRSMMRLLFSGVDIKQLDWSDERMAALKADRYKYQGFMQQIQDLRTNANTCKQARSHLIPFICQGLSDKSAPDTDLSATLVRIDAFGRSNHACYKMDYFSASNRYYTALCGLAVAVCRRARDLHAAETPLTPTTR